MSDPAANVAVAERWHMELFQNGRLDVADEIIAPDFALHSPVGDGQGALAAKQMATELRTVFGDISISHEDIVAADDKVVIRWTSRGTHRGEFLGIAATGKVVHSHGMDLFHLRDGVITEAWIEWDIFDNLQQLGAAITGPTVQGP